MREANPKDHNQHYNTYITKLMFPNNLKFLQDLLLLAALQPIMPLWWNHIPKLKDKQRDFHLRFHESTGLATTDQSGQEAANFKSLSQAKLLHLVYHFPGSHQKFAV